MYYLIGTNKRLQIDENGPERLLWGIQELSSNPRNEFDTKFYYATKSDIQFCYKIVNFEHFHKPDKQRDSFFRFIDFLKAQLELCDVITMAWRSHAVNPEQKEHDNNLLSEVDINLSDYRFSENEFEFEWNVKYVFHL